jgi:hypothetical protein
LDKLVRERPNVEQRLIAIDRLHGLTESRRDVGGAANHQGEEGRGILVERLEDLGPDFVVQRAVERIGHNADDGEQRKPQNRRRAACVA